MSIFLLGLDLGQAADYTALCVIEKLDRAEEERPARTLLGRHLQRYPLGTPYPQIVKAMQRLVATPALAPNYTIVADQTGVGRPVIDQLRDAGLRVVPITITGGMAVTGDGREGFGVPKRDLVSSLQIVMQTGRLAFAEGLPELGVLVKEMQAFKVKITTAANDTYGAWREGDHDDLVLAAGMAAWYAERGEWWMSS